VIKDAARRLKKGAAIGRLLPTYLLFGVLKHFIPLEWLVRWAWSPSTGPRDHEAQKYLVACASRLNRLLGSSDRDCVQRSLLLYKMLSRAGVEPRLVVGFDRTNGLIIGHAWIVIDGCPIMESEDDLRRFSPAFSFGPRGALSRNF